MEIPKDAARHLVGPAAEDYLTEWSRLDGRRRVVGFSWSALLFGPYWMLYRRMNRTCVIFLGALFLRGVTESLVVALLHLPQPSVLFDRAVNLAIGATCGAFGSYWYYLETRRRYQRLTIAGTATPANLERAGGVSRRAVWIGVLLTIGLALLYAIGHAVWAADGPV